MKNIENIEKQNRHLLWMLMEFGIGRYLLSNTHGRLNGYEKAERHMELCAIFLASKMLCSIDRAKSDSRLMDIHDATRELTDHMDREIGFPIDDSEYDHYELSRMFFKRFIELADKKLNKSPHKHKR